MKDVGTKVLNLIQELEEDLESWGETELAARLLTIHALVTILVEKQESIDELEKRVEFLEKHCSTDPDQAYACKFDISLDSMGRPKFL